jgi:(E)-4-hydroxy-3-methylbut-2-enyl-diphosphate synthase
MIERRKTATVAVGPVKLGSSFPVVIQSMTKVATTDVDRCIEQVNRLVCAGCRLVR